MFATILSRFIVHRTLPFSRLLSSVSKNYICDASVIEAYHKNEKLKSIIDRKEHHFYYHDEQNKQLKPPPIFKSLSSAAQLPEKSYYLTNSTIDPKKPNHTSIDEFIHVTFWNDRSKGRFPGLIGMEVLNISKGYSSCQLKVREELLAPNGYLHAGVVVTFADTACGYGCLYSKPAEAKLFTTIELKSNFLGTVKPPAVIKCEAKMIHGGKTTQVWDAEVKDMEKNKIIAIFRCTQLLIY